MSNARYISSGIPMNVLKQSAMNTLHHSDLNDLPIEVNAALTMLTTNRNRTVDTHDVVTAASAFGAIVNFRDAVQPTGAEVLFCIAKDGTLLSTVIKMAKRLRSDVWKIARFDILDDGAALYAERLREVAQKRLDGLAGKRMLEHITYSTSLAWMMLAELDTYNKHVQLIRDRAHDFLTEADFKPGAIVRAESNEEREERIITSYQRDAYEAAVELSALCNLNTMFSQLVWQNSNFSYGMIPLRVLADGMKNGVSFDLLVTMAQEGEGDV